MLTPRQKILWFAFTSRIFIICIQVVFNLFVPDHNAHVFISPPDPDISVSWLDRGVDIVLGGLKRWDAQYFLHISQYGYTYENCLAFFPLFPLTVRYLAYIFSYVIGSLFNFHSLLIISATILNIFYFVKSADALHRLSLKVLKSESLAYKASILYCINPGSIFFTAPYSESLFAWLSFQGMLRCTEVETLRFTNIDILSSIPIGLSLVTRSNGILNLGFILYASFKNVIEKTLPEIFHRYRTLRYRILTPLLSWPLVASVMALVLTLVLSVLPFLLIQVYNYIKFCIPHEHNLPQHLIEGEWILPGQAKGEWCNSSLPVAYSYVQKHYWNVGFLKYYHWKQIPNFILATPILVIVLYNCYKFLRQHLRHSLKLGISVARFQRTVSYDSAASKSIRSSKINSTYTYDPDMFVYVVHGLFLALFSLFFVHVQVTTRMLASSSPLLYWFMALRIKATPSKMAEQNHINEHFRKIGASGRISGDYFAIANLEGINNMCSKWKTFVLSNNFPDVTFKLTKLYFLGYFFIGTVCFCNFFPWT